MLLVDFVLTLVSEKQSSVTDFSEVGVAFAATEPAVDSACFAWVPRLHPRRASPCRGGVRRTDLLRYLWVTNVRYLLKDPPQDAHACLGH